MHSPCTLAAYLGILYMLGSDRQPNWPQRHDQVSILLDLARGVLQKLNLPRVVVELHEPSLGSIVHARLKVGLGHWEWKGGISDAPKDARMYYPTFSEFNFFF